MPSEDRLVSEIVLKSEVDTEEFAKRFAKKVLPPCCINLLGELGAGKTTFSRYFVAALGIKTPVSSPTFVIEHEYIGSEVRVEHWDLYRLNEPPEDLWEPPAPQTIRLIEWANKFPEILALGNVTLEFSVGDDENRRVREYIIK